MSDEFSDYPIIEGRSQDKIRELKNSKQSFLYGFWALSGVAVSLGAVNQADHHFSMLAIIGIIFCAYCTLKINSTISVISIHQGLLRRAHDDNDLTGFRNSASSLNHLLKNNLRRVIFPFMGAI